ncbi:MAG TPA: multiheme c-type cytochrome, partial [Thermoanaerobaculia bacterium]|nr:multiheme c-type cytochrome [Thermoanaerobaculia bacterium]
MRALTSLAALLLLPVLAVGLAGAQEEEPVISPPEAEAPAPTPDGDPHADVFARSVFPSASECATCHPAQYDEWRFSSHAYASISPMFHKFEQRINDLSQGTIGYFCMRCHATVATSLGESRALPLWERARVSREGITCVTCHRVDENYVKVNGERRILRGDVHEPVYGSIGGSGVAQVVENREAYNVAVTEDQFGLDIHREGIRFEQ